MGADNKAAMSMFEELKAQEDAKAFYTKRISEIIAKVCVSMLPGVRGLVLSCLKLVGFTCMLLFIFISRT